jgi:GT2 family glycosyltransferase
MHVTLSIIILNYNTRNLLHQTLQSIRSNPTWEIIVVDNASADDSVAFMKKNYPTVRLIENSDNLGFAAGNNIGIACAQGKYILLLNSDTEIVADALEQLISYLETHPMVGVITPKVVLPDGAIDLACHRGMPTPWNAFTYFSGLERLFPNRKLTAGYHQTYQDFTTIHEVDATACTAAIIRKSVIDKVGTLDERFFFYAEDLDWCKRIKEAGFAIIYYPDAVVLHHKSQSGKNRKGDIEAKSKAKHYFYQTMKQFYDKHYSHTYPKGLRPIIFKGIDVIEKIKN